MAILGWLLVVLIMLRHLPPEEPVDSHEVGEGEGHAQGPPAEADEEAGTGG